MFPKEFVALLVIPFLTLCFISDAAAQSNRVYAKDRSCFAETSNNLSLIDFESVAPDKGVARFPCDKRLSLNKVQLHASGGGKFGSGTIYVLSAPFAERDSLYGTGSGAVLVWIPPFPSGEAFLEITLPKGVTAVSADVWAGSPDTSIDVIATTGDGQTHNTAVTTEDERGQAFVSFVSDGEITSLRFLLPEGQAHLILDNLAYGQTKPGEVETDETSPAPDSEKKPEKPRDTPPVENPLPCSAASSSLVWYRRLPLS